MHRFLTELLTVNIDDQTDFIGHSGGLYNGHIGNFIVALDRDGLERRYGKMTLSVGAVVVRPSTHCCHIDLCEEASFAKHHAKRITGSSLYIHELAVQCILPAQHGAETHSAAPCR